MRHDEHYVEALSTSVGAPVGRLVPIEQIDPNPNQPRQVMGDLSELMASIAEKGIIEPIIVRQRGPRFQIVAGERRYQAAVQVGLREIPIVIREVDDNEIIEVALVENIQRKDLGPFEEAEALHSLAERCGYTHEDLAKRLGKSRTSITESLALASMPVDVRLPWSRRCRARAAPPVRRRGKKPRSPRPGGRRRTRSTTRRQPRRSSCSCGSRSPASTATRSSPRSRASSRNCGRTNSLEFGDQNQTSTPNSELNPLLVNITSIIRTSQNPQKKRPVDGLRMPR
ncbi:MAG: hypothetical protein DMF85_20350 [Acidobacteria bacterium]|nr:MAG: hypothetical protein DMF85_20350 [Acidobacteriota bacterium]